MIERTPLINKIRKSIEKASPIVDTPLGRKKMIYADYTASGRSLDFIEDVIHEQVLPYYANTHTEANLTGRQTTIFREDARDAIRELTNASKDDLVIFCGHGATAAVNVLISQLNLRSLGQAAKDNTVIILGPYEHHSNELPWRSLGLNILRVPLGEDGTLCASALEEHLKNCVGKRVIASFSAASNVTGIRSNDIEITVLLNQYGAISVWDYAAAAPYVQMDMNPVCSVSSALESCGSKSAMFFSMHKFVGGPSTPGVLVVKKSIIENEEPSVIGGGTVSFVTPETHTFLPVGERREEGGTPDIVGSIRAGLVAKLKMAIGDNWIEGRESDLNKKIEGQLRHHPTIEVLGDKQANKLTVTSFRVKTDDGRYIHHGLIVAILNDYFAIQVRGGCSCAGPYGHYLLDLDSRVSEKIQSQIENGNKFVKPGWVRFNLNYFISDEEADYILAAIKYTADNVQKLSTFYGYDSENDCWKHTIFSRSDRKLDEVFASAIECQEVSLGRNQNDWLNAFSNFRDIDQLIRIGCDEKKHEEIFVNKRFVAN